MSRIAPIIAGVLLGAVAGAVPLWLWSDQRVRQVEASVAARISGAEEERQAERDRLESEVRDLQAENEALRGKLARVAELISLRRRSLAAQYRPYRLQAEVGGCSTCFPAGSCPRFDSKPCPPGYWPLLSKLQMQAEAAWNDLTPVEERFIADFGVEETARIYSGDDNVACTVWQRRQSALDALRGASARGNVGAASTFQEATEEFISKWGAPEAYVVGSSREPALCKLGENQRVALYASILKKR